MRTLENMESYIEIRKWVLILGRWVGSGKRSGGRIIFGFAIVGLRFACSRFATVDLG